MNLPCAVVLFGIRRDGYVRRRAGGGDMVSIDENVVASGDDLAIGRIDERAADESDLCGIDSEGEQAARAKQKLIAFVSLMAVYFRRLLGIMTTASLIEARVSQGTCQAVRRPL